MDHRALCALSAPPEFLEVKDVPSFWKGLGIGLAVIPVWFILTIVPGYIVITLISGLLSLLFAGIYQIATGLPLRWESVYEWAVIFVWLLTFVGGSIFSVWRGTANHFRVKAANGNRPCENARRQKTYEDAAAAALSVAERTKAAEDHRLRYRIRELEGLIKTVAEKEADVHRILSTL